MKNACSENVWKNEAINYIKDLDTEEKATHDPNAKQSLTVMGNMAAAELSPDQIASTGATSVLN